VAGGNHNVGIILLLLKYLKGVKGRTRFQKIIYLLKEKYGIDLSYRFMPYYYGPYSDDMQSDIDMLSLLDLLKVEVVSLGEGVLRYEHNLSPKGSEVAEEIEKQLSSNQKRQLQSALNELKDVETDKLVEKAKELMKQKLGERILKELLT